MRGSQDQRRTIGSNDDAPQQLSILHLIVSLGHPNAQYNEHCLPLAGERDISICSYTPAAVSVPPTITLFEGDGTIRGFAAAIDRALASRTFDVVHAHAPGSAALLALGNVRRRRRMPNAVLTVHNSWESFSVRSRLLLTLSFAAFPTIVFCSRAAFDSFPHAIRRIARGTTVVVPNGVDTDRVDRILGEVAPRPPTTGLHVVSVGRLIERKDPDTLVRAFALMAEGPDRLTFVGDGRMRRGILEVARRAGVGSQVTVTGVLAREDVYRTLAAADLFVSTSHNEGLPIAVLEAMACAVPVVVSDIAPHREIVAGATDLALVEPGDVDGFAREMRRCRAMTTEERTRLGARCRELVDRGFSLRQMHRGYEREYEGLRRPSRGRRDTVPAGRSTG